MNDFGFPLKPPNHPRYLNTEFVGHTYPTKTIDNKERLTEHMLRHARIHNQLASDPQYAGGLGWCAFDYNTHARLSEAATASATTASPTFSANPSPRRDFTSRNAIPRTKSCSSRRSTGRAATSRSDLRRRWSARIAIILSSILRTSWWRKPIQTKPSLPIFAIRRFLVDLKHVVDHWGDLRIEGYLNSKLAITKTLSGRGIDQKFVLLPDDTSLHADGADTTRVVLRVTDEYGAIRPLANDSIKLVLEGPAEIIGDNPFALIGGTGAVWIRSKEQAGTARLTATHPRLGTQQVSFEIAASSQETV